MSTMRTLVDALGWARARLEGAVAAPTVDAELLLRHVLSCSRGLLYADPHRRLSDDETGRFRALVERRAAGEPLQYLTAVQAFRHLELAVGPGVLVPRPETEMLVEHALARLADVEGPLVVDVGIGSGAIALSIATERPDAAVWATEISDVAAGWARRNMEAVGAGTAGADRTMTSAATGAAQVPGSRNVMLVEGDLFDPLPGGLRGKVDLVVSNPPYLSEAELGEAPVDVRDHEPALATTAGPTGLEVVRRIVAEAIHWLRPGGWLVLETHPGQAVRLQALMLARYSDVAVHPDLAGLPRIAEGCRPQGS